MIYWFFYYSRKNFFQNFFSNMREPPSGTTTLTWLESKILIFKDINRSIIISKMYIKDIQQVNNNK